MSTTLLEWVELKLAGWCHGPFMEMRWDADNNQILIVADT